MTPVSHLFSFLLLLLLFLAALADGRQAWSHDGTGSKDYIVCTLRTFNITTLQLVQLTYGPNRKICSMLGFT